MRLTHGYMVVIVAQVGFPTVETLPVIVSPTANAQDSHVSLILLTNAINLTS